MMDETEMAQAIVEQWKEKDHTENNVEYEEHYNHYGTRGVVDIVDEWKPTHQEATGTGITVAELKSESALNNVTGANEILRQYKKHIKYFFEGSDYHKRRYFDVSFFLVFYATEKTVKHLRENKEIYRSVDQNESVTVKTVAWHEEIDHYAHIIDDFFWENDATVQKVREVIA